jgi:hypothetical protein
MKISIGSCLLAVVLTGCASTANSEDAGGDEQDLTNSTSDQPTPTFKSLISEGVSKITAKTRSRDTGFDSPDELMTIEDGEDVSAVLATIEAEQPVKPTTAPSCFQNRELRLYKASSRLVTLVVCMDRDMSDRSVRALVYGRGEPEHANKLGYIMVSTDVFELTEKKQDHW